ncbi:hypothetical protein K505DRAFT_415993 [Melanomma pulvis-pyrius CBS 109.77]|uniref:Secreted protein n=1 Tax=Melanomma pulvis-pyrius CBS 109.77 TaxID=1314802 RepID=A0A6A6XIS8_9PLEO|nr:hypothetical protein K505DRAFT_415993 [Melanomma pulvis-pyrius CBS 109.77]
MVVLMVVLVLVLVLLLLLLPDRCGAYIVSASLNARRLVASSLWLLMVAALSRRTVNEAFPSHAASALLQRNACPGMPAYGYVRRSQIYCVHFDAPRHETASSDALEPGLQCSCNRMTPLLHLQIVPLGRGSWVQPRP